MKYPRIINEALELARLHKDIRGCARLKEILRADKVRDMTISEGELEGYPDEERIEKEIIPEIRKECPELTGLLGETPLHDLAAWAEFALEDLALLSGNRPLPMNITPVKNILHLGSNNPPGPEFGILTWKHPGCTVTVTAENGSGYGKYEPIRDIHYQTMWDALMDGWKVD